MSLASVAICDRLATIVQPTNIITHAQQLAAYRAGGKIPAIAVLPETEEQVAEIVRFAAAEKLALVSAGARTKLGMNLGISAYDVALDMTRLDRVIAYDPDDLTLGVQAGMPLSKLAAALAQRGQFLPLVVPFANRATVGGTIASGIDSPLRQFYGTARDYLLGMEFVTGEGKFAKSGGRVVKNVSGYDLHKLLIGSFGSLGVITKINFRTFPLPANVRAFIAFFDSAKEAIEMRHRVAESPLRTLTMEILSPSAVELLASATAARIAADPLPNQLLLKGQWAFVTSFGGNENVLRRYQDELHNLAGVAHCTLLENPDASAMMDRVCEFVPIALESSPATVVAKAGTLPSRMAQAIEDMARAAEDEGLRWAALARVVGVIYFALLPGAGDEQSVENAGRAIRRMSEVCEEREENFTVPWSPEAWARHIAASEMKPSNLELMRKIKIAFDPSGVFAPDPFGSRI